MLQHIYIIMLELYEGFLKMQQQNAKRNNHHMMECGLLLLFSEIYLPINFLRATKINFPRWCLHCWLDLADAPQSTSVKTNSLPSTALENILCNMLWLWCNVLPLHCVPIYYWCTVLQYIAGAEQWIVNCVLQHSSQPTFTPSARLHFNARACALLVLDLIALQWREAAEGWKNNVRVLSEMRRTANCHCSYWSGLKYNTQCSYWTSALYSTVYCTVCTRVHTMHSAHSVHCTEMEEQMQPCQNLWRHLSSNLE